MRFGFALDFGSTLPFAERMRSGEPLLARAREAGIESVWIGESYHRRPGPFHLPAPLLTLSHLAGVTPLRLGTGVLLARAYHPRRLALEAAMVDQISDGRLTLGIGLGEDALRGDLGGPDTAGGAAFDSLVDGVRRAWHDAADDGFRPGPVQPGGPPILVGGFSEAAAVRAATAGDGWYAATGYSDDLVRTQAARYLERLPAGRKPLVAANRLCLIAADRATARARAARQFREVYDFYGALGAWNLPVVYDPSATPTTENTVGDAAPVLVGTPDDVLTHLRRYRDWGVTDVHLRMAPVATSAETTLETIAHVAERIIPELGD